MSVRLLLGDCRAVLPTLAEGSVHCVVTSPPYWGLRDYGTATWDGGDAACDHLAKQPKRGNATYTNGQGGAFSSNLQAWGDRDVSTVYRDTCGKCGARRIDQQLGLELTPEAYVENMVGVFRDVRRVLRDDAVMFVNMGDSFDDKQLVGMPWRLAFALQADGWYLRADIIWAKPNPMPESVTDRPTKAHEYVFLLSKAARYFYDADAVREPSAPGTVKRFGNGQAPRLVGKAYHRERHEALSSELLAGRNLRSVWTIPSAPFPDAHFATFPPALASRCIQAGTSAKGCCRACGAPWTRMVECTDDTRPVINGSWTKAAIAGPTGTERRLGPNGWNLPTAIRQTTGWQPSCACEAPVVPCTVLDPFAGSGTVGEVAERHGRDVILIELSPAYVELARARTAQRGLFASQDACAE